MGGNVGRGKIKMASANTLLSQQRRLTLVHTEKLKPKINWAISGRMLSSGICCSVRFSIFGENPSEEDDYDNYYYEFIACKEPPEVGLVKKVNWKFVLVGGTVHANPT